MRILITTFGPETENTLAAMRSLPYEKLVLVLPEANVRAPELKQIELAEKEAKTEMELVLVDEFDFKDCYREIVDYVRKNATSEDKKKKNQLVINISGGTKIMGDAALLAAFDTGVSAYYCDKVRLIEFPVIQGVALKDMLSDSQIAVIKQMGGRMSVDELAKRLKHKLTPETVRKCLRALRKMGVVRTVPTDGQLIVELTEAGIFILETLSRFDRED